MIERCLPSTTTAGMRLPLLLIHDDLSSFTVWHALDIVLLSRLSVTACQ